MFMTKLDSYLAPFDHVIWDWNGTLLSDVDYAVKTVNLSLAKRQLPTIDRDIYRNNFCFPIRSYYKKIGLPNEGPVFDELCQEFVFNFMQDIHTCELMPGARTVLENVKTSGKLQSILSATDQLNLNKMMDSFGLLHLLDHVYGIEDIYAASKVHRGQQLIAAVPTDKTKTVLVGDTDHDLEVGQAMGISVILVAHGHQCASRLRKLHDTVVEV
jgi:phosphoglycolate phosphatase